MFYGVKKMNRKAIVLFTIMMMVMNSIVFIYGDRLLKVEMSVYVLQLGRYQKKQNSDQMIKQLKEKGYTGYTYKDKQYVVIEGVYLSNKEANQKAKQISQKGITCVVKEYLVNERWKNEIENKKYEHVYKELEKC